ncbi:MAG TPA: hypothetical protein DCY49_02775 [Candidatus Jacksonbacteria bacterium]|nr:MAG: hypothetical protein A3B94_03035 [Candidatus Jacksonbacteria bacterium RIFCSPHIGHO2_02_FULL_43_10]HAZ16798.1 hypothetical protein [Candidatus Jacksonbacteria bacterium]
MGNSMLNTNPPKTASYRFLECIPGILVWLTFVISLILSIVAPLWAVVMIILFDLYWLIKVCYWLVYLFASFKKYHQSQKINWMQKKDEEHIQTDDIIHLVFLPTYKEGKEIIEPTIQALAQSTFPTQQIIPILALEEGDSANAVPIADELKKKYSAFFKDFLITIHPSGLPNEIPGKGSNTHWAGMKAKEWVDTHLKNQPYDRIIVSSFDIDTVVSPHYFAHLTYTYCTTPRPTHASYQPVAMFNNNLWDATTFARVTANSTTFWLLAELSRPQRLFTFSSHSMSFQALVDVGFWQKDIVTEDSRIFLQCLITYNGDYRVVPLFIPVSMDNVNVGDYWNTVKELYKQQRRWAWGIEHLPYMIYHFRKNKKIPGSVQWYYLSTLAEGMYTWATVPILIFILGRLPFWFGQGEFQLSALRQSAPLILHYLLTGAMIGMFVVGIFSLLFLPKPTQPQPWWKYCLIGLQWILIPITMIIFGSIPAIDAQTRLMLGKYLGFKVTKKIRTSFIQDDAR